MCGSCSKDGGVEFLSLSRGWSDHKEYNYGKAEAQGKKLLKILLSNNPEIELHNPIKMSAFKKLLDRKLYEVPKGYSTNQNVTASYNSQKDFFDNKGTDTLDNLIEKSRDEIFKAYIGALIQESKADSVDVNYTEKHLSTVKIL